MKSIIKRIKIGTKQKRNSKHNAKVQEIIFMDRQKEGNKKLPKTNQAQYNNDVVFLFACAQHKRVSYDQNVQQTKQKPKKKSPLSCPKLH